MARRLKKKKPKQERDRHAYIREKLMPLKGIFAKASIGDFSEDVKIPKKIDEFTDLYVGLQIMLDVIREKIVYLSQINKTLEEKITRSATQKGQELFVGSQGKLVRVSLREVLFIKAMGDYVAIKTGNARHVVYSTMKKMLRRLPARDFIRVHKSYIVRIDKISKIRNNLLNIEETWIPVARTRRKELRLRLRKG